MGRRCLSPYLSGNDNINVDELPNPIGVGPFQRAQIQRQTIQL